MFAVEGVLLSTVFRPAWRYSGGALAFNLAGIIGAGPAPMIATVLVAADRVYLVSAYIAVCCVIGAIAVTALRRQSSMTGSPTNVLPAAKEAS